VDIRASRWRKVHCWVRSCCHWCWLLWTCRGHTAHLLRSRVTSVCFPARKGIPWIPWACWSPTLHTACLSSRVPIRTTTWGDRLKYWCRGHWKCSSTWVRSCVRPQGASSWRSFSSPSRWSAGMTSLWRVWMSVLRFWFRVPLAWAWSGVRVESLRLWCWSCWLWVWNYICQWCWTRSICTRVRLPSWTAGGAFPRGCRTRTGWWPGSCLSAGPLSSCAAQSVHFCVMGAQLTSARLRCLWRSHFWRGSGRSRIV